MQNSVTSGVQERGFVVCFDATKVDFIGVKAGIGRAHVKERLHLKMTLV